MTPTNEPRPAGDWRPRTFWGEARLQAMELAEREPVLKRILFQRVVDTCSPLDMMARILANRLACDDLPMEGLSPLLAGSIADTACFDTGWAADLEAVRARDPACGNSLHVVLNLKGFQALAAHRFAHGLWQAGRPEVAHWLSNRTSAVLGVDIHPAARLGKGIMLDHATGIVIGETAVVEDGVSILQGVTLGGTGKEHGNRHPKIRHGALLGAGAKVLGNIEVGPMSKVAAGSVVLEAVPPYCTVAGVPARIVRRAGHGHALGDMLEPLASA